jgi:prepilin-type N-terminal cleavage/methylation domain-containing protein
VTARRRRPIRCSFSRVGRAFSLVEVLIALTITATLLTATMAALDASFKSYKATSESASTNVVARIVMQRVMALIRTGDEFGPYPANPLLNPVLGDDEDEPDDAIEFVSLRDEATGAFEVTRLERREGDGNSGPFELWYVLTKFDADGTQTSVDENVLLDKLVELRFVLSYDVGPRLRRATIDMIVRADDLEDASIGPAFDSPTIRMVASAAPRGLDD